MNRLLMSKDIGYPNIRILYPDIRYPSGYPEDIRISGISGYPISDIRISDIGYPDVDIRTICGYPDIGYFFFQMFNLFRPPDKGKI